MTDAALAICLVAVVNLNFTKGARLCRQGPCSDLVSGGGLGFTQIPAFLHAEGIVVVVKVVTATLA